MESQYRRSMNKAAAQNLEKMQLVNIYQGSVLFSLSPNSFKRLAEAAGATRRIGRAVRYDVQKIKGYLAEQDRPGK